MERLSVGTGCATEPYAESGPAPRAPAARSALGLPIVLGGLVIVAPFLLRQVMRVCDRNIHVELSTTFLVNLTASVMYLGMAYYPIGEVPPAVRVAVLLFLVTLLIMYLCGTTFPRAVLATLFYALAWTLLFSVLVFVAVRVEPDGSVTEDIRRLSPWKRRPEPAPSPRPRGVTREARDAAHRRPSFQTAPASDRT